MLCFFILILIDHQLSPFGRGFPVNRTHIITLYIIAYMLELHGMAYLAYLLDAIVEEALGEGNQLKLPHLDKRRIGGHHRLFARNITLHQKAQRTVYEGIELPEAILPTFGRAQGIS